jgi:hypothetical protein
MQRDLTTKLIPNDAGSSDKPSSGTKNVPRKAVEAALEMNPALKAELASMDPAKAAQALTQMDISQLLTGLSVGGKNQKDMASYKFWQTQPVPGFGDNASKKPIEQGPIKRIDPDQVSKTPDNLIEGFEWCTLDLTDPAELQELYEILNNHYVEDDNAMFRFAYSQSFLHWYDDPIPIPIPSPSPYRTLADHCKLQSDTGPLCLPVGRRSGTSVFVPPSRASWSHQSAVSLPISVFAASDSR